MNHETRVFIDHFAQIVLDDYEVEVPIMQIDRVVEKIGGVVEFSEGFDDFADGSIMKTGENSFLIRVASNRSERRRNFTVAHELGHLFLHMGYRTNPDIWSQQDSTVYQRFGASEAEYQANEFAASLLMPSAVFKTKIDECDSDNRVDVQRVADYFNVSVAAAVNRGRFLGLLA